VYSADLEVFGEQIKKILPEGENAGVDGRGCSPMFLVLRGKAVKAAIDGCNSPKLEAELTKHMPKLVVVEGEA
jgi:hypothetical protein